MFLYRSNFGDVLYFAPASIALNEWCHLAWSHDGTTLRVFKDGVEVGDTTWGTQGAFGSAGNLWVGKFLDYTEIDHDARGYIDDLRITKGVARYTANFTPPTAPFPNQ